MTRRTDRIGSASVEAALAISLVLIPLCLGMVDMAATLAVTARLDRALQAAVYYVWANPTSLSASNIQQAANAAYGSASPTLSVSTSTACSCVLKSYQPVSSISCSNTCPSGQTRASYMTISASTSYPLPAPLPWLTSPQNLSFQGTVRTQ